ncbi:MAG: polysaccharide biosynthesis protein [Planctomycetales bacterium]|nr:polysaccharide biosynthesis protein [Planctomycetales bacterium]
MKISNLNGTPDLHHEPGSDLFLSDAVVAGLPGPDTEDEQGQLGGNHLSRFVTLLVFHIAVLSLAYFLSFELRFDGDIPEYIQRVFFKTLPGVVLIQILSLRLLGGFYGWWRSVSFADLVALGRAVLVAIVLILVADVLFFPWLLIPRSVVLIDGALTIIFLGALRSLWRFTREHLFRYVGVDPAQRSFVVGAGLVGERFIQQLHSHPELGLHVVGVLDDNPRFRGSFLAGVPVIGRVSQAIDLAQIHNVRHLLIMSNSLPGKRVRDLVKKCHGEHIDVKMIPSVDEILGGAFQMRIRDVEIEDLLKREPVQLDRVAIGEMLRGKRVLVTGAGGSIGSEICRQVLKEEADLLILVDRTENNLFRIEQEIRRCRATVPIVASMADVCDLAQLRPLFEQYAPEIVFHAAAHKHVPLMELHPGRAVANNILGTKVVADLAAEHRVDRFVLISTDKAVQPTSVMGASKQLAERYVHSLGQLSNSTAFIVVRFGNVLASDGSVVPIFQEQIRRGGPVTITHREMVRFFMTIPEASQLVLQAAAIGSGSEIFVLDMGEPVKIVDLAREMIRLSGHTSDSIKIEEIGMRPGEKLYEELFAEEEEVLDTSHPRIHACYQRFFDVDEVERTIAELAQSVYDPREVILRKLSEAVPEFSQERELVGANFLSQSEPIAQLANQSENGSPS